MIVSHIDATERTVEADAMARCSGTFGRHSRVPRMVKASATPGRDAGWMLATPLRSRALRDHSSFSTIRRFADVEFIRCRRHAAAAQPDLTGMERFVDARSQRT